VLGTTALGSHGGGDDVLEPINASRRDKFSTSFTPGREMVESDLIGDAVRTRYVWGVTG
jgi:hypothetical protein